MVGVRCPVKANICCLLSATFTGRPASRAASAARMACGRVVPFDPKPPPTCGEITRTRCAGRPSTEAIVSRSADGPCVESQTVSLPLPQAAIAACGSMGLLCWAGVVYVTDTRTSARASPAGTSP
jgi:hypothetical protein